MTYDPEKHHRRSIRLQGYDYSQPGAYFVTICVEGHLCLFGNVVDGAMELNPAGHMIHQWWQKMPGKFEVLRLDAGVIMPNHFHGVLVITDGPATPPAPPKTNAVGADPRVRPKDQDTRPQKGTHAGKKGTRAGVPLPQMVQWFKTMTTNAYIRGVKTRGWRPFPGRLWQRNYYERIVRSRRELRRIRRYITENPSCWL